jgi:hypothetical protein
MLENSLGYAGLDGLEYSKGNIYEDKSDDRLSRSTVRARKVATR